MKKLLFLAALTMVGAATVSAADTGEKARNAVCVTLKSGDAKYIAFKENPIISSENGQLTVSSATENCTLAELADVSSITAVYHDFTVDGISALEGETQRTVKGIYDLNGKRVDRIVPGNVYVLKFSDGSTLKTAGK